MTQRRAGIGGVVVAALMALPGSAWAQSGGASTLAGTSWQLVRFQGGDDTVVTPEDGSKYTIAFAADGAVSARIDCNRGRGTWRSDAPGQLEFGPMALTRALCLPPSMHDQLVKHWPHIRSYVLKDGHLFLSLMADGGIYEFRPMTAASTALKSPLPPTGPVTWTCGAETLRATFYRTKPAMVLLEKGGVTTPAFQVRAASGSRYEGDGVLYWEARGEVTLDWQGVRSTCRKNRGWPPGSSAAMPGAQRSGIR
jgi:heat shock protein HslJ/membrane-bound inhibitor of C-type lysozyme